MTMLCTENGDAATKLDPSQNFYLQCQAKSWHMPDGPNELAGGISNAQNVSMNNSIVR